MRLAALAPSLPLVAGPKRLQRSRGLSRYCCSAAMPAGSALTGCQALVRSLADAYYELTILIATHALSFQTFSWA